MEELKSCPFCGSKPEIIENADFLGTYTLLCSNENCFAGAQGAIHISKIALIEAWNTRVEKICECGYPATVHYCPDCGGRIE